MGRVITQLSMSLDGFVASPTDGVEHLFDWYSNGPVAVETPGEGGPAAFQVSEASADHVREMINGCPCSSARGSASSTTSPAPR
jgi:hypothetical protein